MKTYKVFRKGYENEWYFQDAYKESKGYKMFFNLGVFNIQKDGHTILQGGADNFYYEIEYGDS